MNTDELFPVMAVLGEPESPMSPGGPATSVLERPETQTEPELDDGDRDRFAHYVRKEKILESAMSGQPVIALCGKVWVPGRDPKNYPVCPACKEIYESLNGGQPGGKSGNPGSGGSDAG